MNGDEQRLALVPIAASVDMAEQLLVYETAAAKVLKISIREFRRLVDLSVIPFRLHNGRKKRLYYMDDLRAYAKSLEPRYAKKATGSLVDGALADPSPRHWRTVIPREFQRSRGDER